MWWERDDGEGDEGEGRRGVECEQRKRKIQSRHMMYDIYTV